MDIQDENGRHEVGFVHNTEKFPIGDSGCRFEAAFEINKVYNNIFLLGIYISSFPEGISVYRSNFFLIS